MYSPVARWDNAVFQWRLCSTIKYKTNSRINKFTTLCFKVAIFKHKKSSATSHHLSDGRATALSHFWYTLSFGLSVQQLLDFSNVTFSDQLWSLFIPCIAVADGSRNPVMLPPSPSPPVLQVARFSGHSITMSTTIASFKACYRNWRVLMCVSDWIKLLNSITVYTNSSSAPPSHTKPAYCKCAGFCLCLHNYTSRLYHTVLHWWIF